MALPGNDIHARRRFFNRCGVGLGSIALSSLLDKRETCAESQTADLARPMIPRPPHFAPRAKSVICLFMMGGPSHLDLFDYKPDLEKYDGQPIPPSYIEGERFEQIKDMAPKVMRGPWSFGRYGETGTHVSELLPYTREIVDDLTFVRTVRSEETVHPHAQLLLFTGHRNPGRPSLGSWVSYGLGSEAEDLPAFIAFGHGSVPQAHDGLFSNGFLPSTYHGTQFRNRGAPVLNLADPKGVTRRGTKRVIKTINKLNAERLNTVGDSEIASRISAYELAFRLQASAPDLIDLRGESQATLNLYGADLKKPSFALDCILARRMVERGVRFVQLHYGDWDHHGNIVNAFPPMCRAIDQGCAALIKDLKARGLLDETLVIWGGEFGRTPVAQPQKIGRVGRDHHVHAFTMWMAGGGLKPGTSVGTTDDLGFHPVEDSIHVHDLQATVLHLLGLDHERLTYRFQGRDFRLTDVGGRVVEKLFI